MKGEEGFGGGGEGGDGDGEIWMCRLLFVAV